MRYNAECKMSKVMDLRTYKGYAYWGKKGEWFCDLFQEPFNTIADFKFYINDRISCGE